MKIIAICGLDKAGKHTQAVLLYNYLSKLGYKVAKSEFHRYDTLFGSIIKDWLNKKIDLSKETLELVITADKQNQQDWFKELEADGYDYLILDRYIGSQLAYGLASGLELDWLLQLNKYMIKPFIEIIIDINENESYNRRGKFGDNDRYEEDIKFLKIVRNIYRKIYEGEIQTYNCRRAIVSGELGINQIHEIIVGNIKLYENNFQKNVY